MSLARREDGLVAGWYDTRDGNAEIYLRLLDELGRPSGPEYRLTDDAEDSFEVDIDAVGSGFAVAWYDKDAAGTLRGRLGFWQPESGFEWRTDLSPPGRSSRNPVVDVLPDRIFCAWVESIGDVEAVVAAWWSLDGEALGPPVVLGPAAARTWNLNATLDDEGRAYVVFDADVETAEEELYLARLDRSRITLVRLTSDDGHRSKYPDLALSGSRAALTWFDERDGNREVYLFVGTVDELDSDVERRARRITYTPGESIGAYVAWNGERIGLAWTDELSSTRELHFQTFDADGEPSGPIERLTRTPTRSSIPSIRAWRSGFAIAWNEIAPGPDGIHDPDTRSEVELRLLP